MTQEKEWWAIIVGPIIIVRLSRRVLMDKDFTGGVERVKLQAHEFSLLRYIAERREEIVSTSDLATLVNGNQTTVNAYISRIRSKLEEVREGSSKHLVTCKAERGYMLSSSPSRSLHTR